MMPGDPRGGGEDSGGGAGGLLEPAARPAAAPHQVPVNTVTPGVSILSGGSRRGWAHANIYYLRSIHGVVRVTLVMVGPEIDGGSLPSVFSLECGGGASLGFQLVRGDYRAYSRQTKQVARSSVVQQQ